MRIVAAWFLALGILGGALGGTTLAVAADPDGVDETGATLPPDPPPGEPPQASHGLGADIGAYVTAPARWGTSEWLGFGGALGAIAIAHQYDRQTSAPFLPPPGAPKPANHDLQDIAPAAALFVGTSVYAYLTQDTNGTRESLAMLEAASFSGVTAFALQHAAGRESPADSSDPNSFHPGSAGSFPSVHVTLAFAVGTVMAESGSDDYRWLRRVLGYGVGVLTSYERIKHSQHWLSDTVAGAALGISTAHFAIQRRFPQDDEPYSGGLSVLPVAGGLMLSYNVQY